MKISIVIPVYNEADQLQSCLEAIALQKLKPHEVIVVDNNSTDGSAPIARQFSFVTVMTETAQGVVHARNTGFDVAKGDIIARIDADTLLPADWTLRLKQIFKDRQTAAVSGAPHYYDFAWSGLADKIDLGLRAHLARKLKQTNFLWGANMAVRRSAWQIVRPELCAEADMHEDFDLAIHLQRHNFRVDYKANLLAGVSSRRIDTNFLAYVRYSLVSPRTYAAHRLASRFHMYPVLAICWLFYLPARLVYRGFDPVSGKFSWSKLLALSEARVDPTSNIV